MTTLLLDAHGAAAFDLAYVDAPEFVLWRSAGCVALSLDERYADSVRRALAYHGVGAIPSARELHQPAHLVRAIGTTLLPARLGPEDVDRIDVRVVPLAEATAALLRRPLRRWPVTRARRSRCRALLRGSDALFEARRRAWCSRSTLSRTRDVLRAVVFDHSASARPQRVYATDGALSTWVRG